MKEKGKKIMNKSCDIFECYSVNALVNLLSWQMPPKLLVLLIPEIAPVTYLGMNDGTGTWKS